MSFDTLKRTLASAVADSGTFTVGYPAGRGPGDYTGGRFHEVNSFTTGRLRAEDGRIAVSFGASEVTITNQTGQTIPANTEVYVQLDRVGRDNDTLGRRMISERMAGLQTVIVNLGAPITSDPNGLVETQAATALSGLATGFNGALVQDGVGVLDVPRALVAAWTGTAVITVHGYDEYGNAMSESSASGTSFAGKKAFKRVTGFETSADITGLTVGTGKVLGLPVFLPGTGYVLRELLEGAAPTAGTIVAGDLTKATATTGDVRGTYAPNGTPNGANSWQLVIAVDDVAFGGVPQYAA